MMWINRTIRTVKDAKWYWKLFVFLLAFGFVLGFTNHTLQIGFGNSMHGTLPKINIALVNKCPCNPVVGDIVVFWHERYQTNVTHRIIDIQGEQMKTKGDGNTFDDGWTPLANVKGVVDVWISNTPVEGNYPHTPIYVSCYSRFDHCTFYIYTYKFIQES
jgi:signal peptidase I